MSDLNKKTDKRSKQKNIALVGAGYWGKNLVRVFFELGVLKIICDLNEKNLLDRKKEFPALETTGDYNSILADDEIKAVVIATPAATHYDVCKKAMLAGKDVFVEKPLALKVKDAEELVQIAQKNERILMVGHLLLYHPAVVKLKELISKGELGDIRYIYSNRLNFGKLRKEENVLWSFAPHDISVIIDILGMPKKVASTGKSYLQKDIPDTTMSMMEFDGEKAAHIFVSWLNPFKEQKFSVIGSKAMAVFDDQSKDKLIVFRHEVRWLENGYPDAVKAEGEIMEIAKGEPLREEAMHFLECVQKRKEARTDGKSALNVLKVLDACQRSMENGGKAISLLSR